MNCDDIQNLLPFYPDEVDEPARKQIEEHLERCPNCRELMAAYEKYRSHLSEAVEPDLPLHFEQNVLDRIETKTRQIILLRSFPSWAGIAALIMGAALIITSLLPLQKETIELTFVPDIHKKGKGPAEGISHDHLRYSHYLEELFSGIGYPANPSFMDPHTGLYDYFIFNVPKAEYNAFVEKYNALPGFYKIPEMAFKRDRGLVQVKVNFDMIQYAAGDFNGDGFGDYIIQHLSGTEKGAWYLYPGNGGTNFGKGIGIDVGNDKDEYLGDYTMLPGDYNGDGWDDICLVHYPQTGSIASIVLINDHHHRFIRSKVLSWELTLPGDMDLVTLLAGDSDGDRVEEYYLLYKKSDVYYMAPYKPHINHNLEALSFAPVDFIPGTTLPFMGDMDGDGYGDLCMKIMQGEETAQTHIYFNDRAGGFKEPHISLRSNGTILLSFQGSYDFWAYDHNGDGMDDVGVKDGGDFVSGQWFVCYSAGNGNFGEIKAIYPTGTELNP